MANADLISRSCSQLEQCSGPQIYEFDREAAVVCPVDKLVVRAKP